MNTGLSWSYNSKQRSPASTPGTGAIFDHPAIFDPQWSVNISYTVGYRSNFRPGYQSTDIWGRPIFVDDRLWSEYDQNIQQTLSFNGKIDLTSKWNITFNSGYDFVDRKISHTMFNIVRNLHCWTMTFSWAPFGDRREWSFGIRLNSNMLGDVMKYDRRRTHREFGNDF